MAIPRVFVSSTCYDLQEVRYQLRQFIDDFGFDPVMSEFGDIFYNYDRHVQDACKDEIEKCHLFILIIGNNYGSIYHEHRSDIVMPDSVTLQEFKKALDTDKPKHIFINKFVNYDYQNYKRALEKKLVSFFKDRPIEESKVEAATIKVKNEFNSSYTYHQDSYRYIFYFLDIINSLKSNNAVISFETFDEIKLNLKKQWGGLMYEALVKPSTVSIDVIKDLHHKFEKVETQLKSIATSKVEQPGNDVTVSFDLSKFLNELNLESLETLKDKAAECIISILKTSRNLPRIKFREQWSDEKTKEWFEYLEEKLQDYKWSKYIEITVVFNFPLFGINYVYYKDRMEIPYTSLFELTKIYKNLTIEDQNSFVKVVTRELNKLFEQDKAKNNESEDDLPF